MRNGFCRLRTSGPLVAALLWIVLCTSPTVADDKITIDAIVEYEGNGQVYRTGETRGTFVGAINGQLSVEGEKPPLHAGHIVCPALVVIEPDIDQQYGNGQCVITTDDGAQIFAEWSCRGKHMVGCSGKMKLIGGTARLAGITGGGPLIVKTKFRGVGEVSSRNDSAAMFGRGVLILRGFVLKNPPK